MKARHFLFAVLILSLSVTACEKNTDPTQTDQTPKTFTVKFNPGGEFSVTQQPLSRLVPDDRDLYAIQVWHKPVSENSYDEYAYGLFDNLENATLELTENYNYIFEVLFIDDAKDKIFRDSILVDSQNYLGYGEPFTAYNKYNASTSASITKLSDEFIYANDRYFYNLSRPKYCLPDGSSYYTPENIDVFYGKVNDFVPQEGVSEISIYLKRINYGIRVEVGDFFDEGTITISERSIQSDGFGRDDWRRHTLTPENKNFETIFAHYEVSSWYSYVELEKATASHRLDFKWIKNDGTVINWDGVQIACCRLKKSILSLNYYGEDEVSDNNTLVFNYEDTTIEETYKNYTHGEDQGDYEW